MKEQPILIVDDNPLNLKLLRVMLQGDGYQVQTVNSATEALAYLAEHRPSLILMDLQLPDIDGLTLTQQLKQNSETKDIKIIAVTAYAMKGDSERALNAGCDGYITKPIEPTSFFQTIQKLFPPSDS